jgi:hypothetical protein
VHRLVIEPGTVEDSVTDKLITSVGETLIGRL